jgi:hypothetical protein
VRLGGEFAPPLADLRGCLRIEVVSHELLLW